MPHPLAALVAGCVLLALWIPCTDADIRELNEGYKLPQKAGYLIVAPRQVRPGQVFRVDVTIYHMYHKQIIVRATLSRSGEQYAYQTAVFKDATARVVELNVPDSVLPGEHRLLVEGLVDRDTGDALFKNETKLDFVSKHISIFIQTDKPLYAAEETVDFRVIGVSPGSLKPVFGSMTVYVLDGKRNVVRRWQQQQLNMGVFQAQFTLAYPLQIGTWTIAVEGFGHRYEDHFQVEFFYPRRFEVNVTVPMSISNKDWGVAGSLYGEHMGAIAAQGNVTIKLWVREEDGTQLDGELEKKVQYVKNEFPFEFTMEEIRQEFGDVTDKELHFKAWFFDWEWVETQNGTARTKVVREGVEVKVVGRHLRTFKPGFPFTVYFTVQRPDGSPYEGQYNRVVFIQTSHEGKSTNTPPLEKVIIPDDNLIAHTVTPGKEDTRIRIRCWHSTGEHTTEEVILYKYYSPKKMYISVSTSTDDPEVGKYMVFTVRTNVFVDQINYIIASRGNILLGNQLRMKSQQKTFGIAVSRQMAPFARMLVYFVFDDEVVSDGLSFFVSDARLFQANVEVNTGKDFSGDTIELIGHGPPGSYMSFASVDYELYRRGMRNFIDEEKILDDLQTYEEGGQTPYRHIWHYNDDRWDESIYVSAPVGGMDTLQNFEMAGLHIFSDMNFTGQSFEDQVACNKSLGLARCPDSQCFLINKTCDGFLDCRDGYDEMACPMEEREVPHRKPVDMDYLQRHVRWFNDHKWLFHTTYIMPVGRTEIQVEVPETMDPYVITALVLHPEEGLSIVRKDAYAAHDTTRTFFMALELPESSRRGEQIGVRCSLFNEQEERIEVILTLHGNDDYRFVNVEEFGFVTSYNPRTTAGDIQTMVSLESGEYRYVHFPVLPIIESGEVTVVVSAYTFFDSDIEEATIEVRMDGVENGDYTPYLIDLVNQGSIIIPDFHIAIPEQFWVPEQRWHLYVPGSQAATVSLFGDVVTPGFFEDHLSTDVITGLPHDSAEGYMFDFAINLQTMKYLQATSALTTEAATKAMNYMKDILMRQYAYMQEDGSFKMFRRTEKPCLWVTAFICRSLHAALESEWNEELYIEVDLLNKVTGWIADQQDDSGAFIETADVLYDRNMSPYTTTADGIEHEWHIALTTYVTITLAQLSRISGDAKTKAVSARSKAALYLESKWPLLDDPFQMSMTAYALQATSNKDKDSALSRLRGMARRQGDGIYWSAVEIPANPEFIVNTVHIMEARPDYDNLGNAVTATGYALMMYMQKNQEPWLADSVGIMKWLQTQRMGMTVWSSTQDTLVALEALTMFALGETNRFIYQMEVVLHSTFTPTYEDSFKLNMTNFDTLFTSDIPLAHGQVKAYAKGTGYAMLQLDSTHNVEYPFLQSNPDYESYHVEMVKADCLGRNCSIFDLELCIKYSPSETIKEKYQSRFTRPDITKKTGLTFVTYEVPTGYVVSRDTIEAMYQAGTEGLRRVRFRDSTLIVFFEYITMQNTCFNTRLERWYPVANMSIQQGISAFEYAETGLQNNTLYTTWTLHLNHICQVCGSFQCPYCPNYNAAPYTRTSVLLILGAVLTALLTTQQLRRNLCLYLDTS